MGPGTRFAQGPAFTTGGPESSGRYVKILYKKYEMKTLTQVILEYKNKHSFFRAILFEYSFGISVLSVTRPSIGRDRVPDISFVL